MFVSIISVYISISASMSIFVNIETYNAHYNILSNGESLNGKLLRGWVYISRESPQMFLPRIKVQKWRAGKVHHKQIHEYILISSGSSTVESSGLREGASYEI